MPTRGAPRASPAYPVPTPRRGRHPAHRSAEVQPTGPPAKAGARWRGRHTKRQPRGLRADDEWIRRHFEELVDTYAGQYAVVAAGELFVGTDAKELFATARRKHPDVVPTGLPVPRPQDFVCAL